MVSAERMNEWMNLKSFLNWLLSFLFQKNVNWMIKWKKKKKTNIQCSNHFKFWMSVSLVDWKQEEQIVNNEWISCYIMVAVVIILYFFLVSIRLFFFFFMKQFHQRAYVECCCCCFFFSFSLHFFLKPSENKNRHERD